jgi:hypothetical protein
MICFSIIIFFELPQDYSSEPHRDASFISLCWFCFDHVSVCLISEDLPVIPCHTAINSDFVIRILTKMSLSFNEGVMIRLGVNLFHQDIRRKIVVLVTQFIDYFLAIWVISATFTIRFENKFVGVSLYLSSKWLKIFFGDRIEIPFSYASLH